MYNKHLMTVRRGETMEQKIPLTKDSDSIKFEQLLYLEETDE